MKTCWKCRNYGCMVNQGYWWCNLNKDMDTDDCEGYEEVNYEGVSTYATSETPDWEIKHK